MPTSINTAKYFFQIQQKMILSIFTICRDTIKKYISWLIKERSIDFFDFGGMARFVVLDI